MQRTNAWSALSPVRIVNPVASPFEQFKASFFSFSQENNLDITHSPTEFPILGNFPESSNDIIIATTIEKLSQDCTRVYDCLILWRPFSKGLNFDQIPEELQQFMPSLSDNDNHPENLNFIIHLDNFFMSTLRTLQLVSPFPQNLVVICLQVRSQCDVYIKQYAEIYPDSVPVTVMAGSVVAGSVAAGSVAADSVAAGTAATGIKKPLTCQERFTNVPDEIYNSWKDMGFEWVVLHAILNSNPKTRNMIISTPPVNYKVTFCNKANPLCPLGMKCSYLTFSETTLSSQIGDDNFRWMAWLANACASNICNFGMTCTKERCGRTHYEDVSEAVCLDVRKAFQQCSAGSSGFYEMLQNFLNAYKQQRNHVVRRQKSVLSNSRGSNFSSVADNSDQGSSKD